MGVDSQVAEVCVEFVESLAAHYSGDGTIRQATFKWIY